MNRIRTSVGALAMSIAITGCVVIPDQPQIVSQTTDGNISIVSETCQIDSAQPPDLFNQNMNNQSLALDPHGFSVLNWNIYKGNRDDLQHDLKQFSTKQDIVLLQEALLTDELKNSLDRHALKWLLNTAFLYDDRRTGVMTAAKVDTSYHCALRAMEPIIRTPKTTLISVFSLAGMPEQLMVANIHGINFTLALDAYGKQLHALEEILAQHSGPIVLAGDFNNWSNDRTRLLLELARRLSLQQLPYENHNRTMVLGNAIDHIFYRGLSVIYHETHQVSSSDHNPITVMFKATQTRIARNP
ncbi:endonuclease/exonuclease/phosphatase family protein [Kaarinaea lacus]